MKLYKRTLFAFVAAACIALGAGCATTIHDAANGGDLPGIANALKEGQSLESRNDLGMTPLQAAVWSGQVQSVARLLEAGAKVDAVDRDGNQAIHTAMWPQNKPILPPLFYGRPPVPDQVRIIELLVESGADVNALDEDGNTPMMIAALFWGAPKVETLIRLKADVNIKNKAGNTALAVAESRNNSTIVQMLKAAGAK